MVYRGGSVAEFAEYLERSPSTYDEQIGVAWPQGRVGIEAGPLSQWLVNGLTAVGLPVVCVETRHMMALLKAQQINKSDRNDARGIAWL
jgi:transposase